MSAAEYSWLQVSHHNLNRWDGSRAYVTRLVTLVKIHEISGGGVEGYPPPFHNFSSFKYLFESKFNENHNFLHLLFQQARILIMG